MTKFTTHITDYISAQVLQREGYVHVSDQQALLEALDTKFLTDNNYVKAEKLRHVYVTVSKASEIAGCSRKTLDTYIRMGYLAIVDGKINLAEVVNFDYKTAKADYLEHKAKTSTM